MTKKFELLFNRIKKATDSKTDKELCEFLDLNKSTLSMWKKREKVDYELLFTKIEQTNFHWLITGVGKMSTTELDKENKKDDKDQYIIELQRELIEALKAEVAELKKINEQGSHYRIASEPDS